MGQNVNPPRSRFSLFFVIVAVLAAVAAAWVIDRRFDRIDDSLAELLAPGVDADEVIQSRRVSDAVEREKNLDAPSARELNSLLQEVDSWFFVEEDEEKAVQFKQNLIARLQERIAVEVRQLHKQALESQTGKDGQEKHAEAGQLLQLYPVTTEESSTAEARELLREHGEIASRLQVLQRQRYNAWAVGQIERALKGYREKSSWLPGANPELVNILVDCLWKLDPALLEPAVSELYYSTIQRLSEEDKIELAKKLTEPDTKRRRKILDDF